MAIATVDALYTQGQQMERAAHGVEQVRVVFAGGSLATLALLSQQHCGARRVQRSRAASTWPDSRHPPAPSAHRLSPLHTGPPSLHALRSTIT